MCDLPGGSEQVSARIFATATVASFAVPGGVSCRGECFDAY